MEKIALVTGANRGIGREICRQLAMKGFTVILGARTLDKATRAADALARDGAAAEPVALDLTDPRSVNAAAKTVEERHGRLDVLVNNAGVLFDQDDWGGGIAGLDEKVLRDTLETNLIGTYRVCRAFFPLLKKTGGARIVNVSSGAGQLEGMGLGAPAYKISKTAVNALTKILAAEGARDVRVNAACPGWVNTDMGGPGAPRTAEEGADGIVWLAASATAPTGGFFRDRKPIPW
jgi:NAD(P)-dependent dehydrogenase (short-subunit alcohol dehydrogenase family)